MRRSFPFAVAGIVLALVLSPLVPGQPDSFPLSTYPIYAHDRSDVAHIPTAVGVTAGEDRVRLGLGSVAATDDPLLGTARVAAAIRAGDAAGYCDGVAERVAGQQNQAGAVVTVEVVTERRQLVPTATGDDGLLDRTVHATCRVPDR